MSTIKKAKNTLNISHPDLAAEWDYEKNAPMTPNDVTYGSNSKIWWKCSKGHEYTSIIRNRIRGDGCPYCSGKRAIAGITDLVTVKPELLSEWDYDKNNDLHPEMITAYSNKRVWWKCKRNHEWQAIVSTRCRNKTGCPYCSGRLAIAGETDLKTTHPELIEEWNYEKNKGISPADMKAGSIKKVWWVCKYGHEWQASPNNRTRNHGCPFCANRGTSKAEQGIAYYLSRVCEIKQRTKICKKEVDVYLPLHNIAIEYDGLFFHKGRVTQDNEKTVKLLTQGVKLIRIIESNQNCCCDQNIYYIYDNMGPNYVWALRSLFSMLTQITGDDKFDCIEIDIQRDSIKIRERFDLVQKENSLETQRPDLVKEWNYKRNGVLTPDIITYGTNEKVWWICEKGHEWQSKISNRIHGRNCPICSNKRVLVGYNDLQTTNPEIASGWNYEKNYKLYPNMVTNKSGKKVWWKCEYGHEWVASIADRSLGRGCPICSNKQVVKGINDLLTTHKKLAEEWNYEKNDPLLPDAITLGSGKKVWWKCSKGHEWKAVIASRAQGFGCPFCSGRFPVAGQTDLATTRPDLTKEWNFEKNKGLSPSDVTAGSGRCVWWRGECGHEWLESIVNRSKNRGCPFCSNHKLLPGFNDLATTNPLLAREWNYPKNAPVLPSNVFAGSQKKVWWICSNGHEWLAVIGSRERGNGCPYCSGRGHQSIKCIETGEVFSTFRDVEKKYGINSRCVSNCCRGISKTAGGYHWVYFE